MGGERIAVVTLHFLLIETISSPVVCLGEDKFKTDEEPISGWTIRVPPLP